MKTVITTPPPPKKKLKTSCIEATLDKFYRLTDFEQRRTATYTAKNYSLAPIKALLRYLGHPENAFKSYHIVGTKGKGSTAYYLSQLLKTIPAKVGTYTSPHIFDIRERIAIDTTAVSWEVLIPTLEEILLLSAKKHLPVTLFDVLTAVAFVIFKQAGIDIAVIEAGLGGRWDSTNVLTPPQLIATLVTRIDYDHMNKLGNTIRAITIEKAEVIRTGVPVYYLTMPSAALASSPGQAVTPCHEKDVRTVLHDKIITLKTTLHEITPPHQTLARLKQANTLTIAPPQVNPAHFAPALMENLSFALAVYEATQPNVVSRPTLAKLLKVPPPLGRYTHLAAFPHVILDGAHTPLAMQYLLEEIRTRKAFQRYQQVTIGFYAFFDKAIEDLVTLIPREWNFVFCRLHLPFVSPAHEQEVCDRAARVRQQKKASFDVTSTLASLNVPTNTHQLYVFTGSFKLIATVCRDVLGMMPLRT